MHLSVHSAALRSSHSVIAKHPSNLVRRGQQFAQQLKDATAEAISFRTRSARKIVSLSSHFGMTTLFKSSGTATVLEDSTLEARYYSLERSLQLAYAVRDRDRIAILQAEIEQLTGWRFSRR